MPCTNPPALLYGDYDASEYGIGMRANYTCNVDYYMVDETTEMLCAFGPFWLGSIPTCKRMFVEHTYLCVLYIA